MKKISKQVKAIADRHIEARLGQRAFDEMPDDITLEQLLSDMMEGKTYEYVIKRVEAKFCSIGSSVMAHVIQHCSKSYQSAVYKGFRIIYSKTEGCDSNARTK